MTSVYAIYRHEILGDAVFSRFLRRLILSFGDACFSVSLIDVSVLDAHALRVVLDLVDYFGNTGLIDQDFQAIYSDCYRREMGDTLDMISMIVIEQDSLLSDLLENK